MRIHTQCCAAAEPPPCITDPDILAGHLEDASGLEPGRARGLVRPTCEAEVAAVMRWVASTGSTLIAQGARSSLTGGAVPRGDVALSLAALDGWGAVQRDAAGRARLTAQAGARLDLLQQALAEQGWFYPPVPTFAQATLGGTVATNAGGAATFKYGATRDWVRGLRVILAGGDVLELTRGEALVRPGERVEIVTSTGCRSFVAPTYRLPAMKKVSAGYHAADPLDLVDLFVGAEGTLGVVTSITVDLVPRPAALLTGFVPVTQASAALRLAAALRAAALEGRRGDAGQPDVRAIEWADAGALDLLRDSGEARQRRVPLAEDATAAVWFEVESTAAWTDEAVLARLDAALGAGGDWRDDPLHTLFGLLRAQDALERLELALPGDPGRGQTLTALREAVPRRLNERLAAARRRDPTVHKLGGDLIVPIDQLEGAIQLYEEGFERRGLRHATWGHLADGNLHPNPIPETAAQMHLAWEAQIEFAQAVTALGGCPLSEHGVGRHPLKQALLRGFLGDDAIGQMRRIRQALDPESCLAPGVLFAAEPRSPAEGFDAERR